MKRIITFIMLSILTLTAYGRDTSNLKQESDSSSKPSRKFFVRIPYHTLNLFKLEGIPSVGMIEVHAGYRIDKKNTIGIKAARWKLFEPMGIQFWDPLLLKKSEWYPGRIKEYGLGLLYQRFLYKGLYASVEVMPMMKTFVDENDKTIAHGFKLYTTYHVGYYFSFFKNRLFVEPQIHVNYWPINSKGPEGFKKQEEKHDNYFLFEPNIYIGYNF